MSGGKCVLCGRVMGWLGRTKKCVDCLARPLPAPAPEPVLRIADPAPGRFHSDGRDTEQAAAESVSHATGRLRQQVLELLGGHPAGLTDDEGGALMDGDRLRFGRRRSELCKEGLVADSTLRRTTPAGRRAVVWVLTVEGRATLAQLTAKGA